MLSAAAERPMAPHRSLRARGLLAVLLLLVYVVASGAFISRDHRQLDEAVTSIDGVTQHEKVLAVAFAAVSGAVIDATDASHASVDAPAAPDSMRLYVENCTRVLDQLAGFDAAYAGSRAALVRSFEALVARPNRANWIDLREVLHGIADEFDGRLRDLGGRRDQLTSVYRQEYANVTRRSFILAGVGLVIFGAVVAWFFHRLARDLEHLEVHAREIVSGQRGVAMPVTRDDELGRLMAAVNRMAGDLDEREKRIELEGERRSHQDKMQAVGALAAGVAHEVNNPLAVIVGAAQRLSQAGTMPAADIAEQAKLIRDQAERAAQVARRLADAAAPQASDLDWLDVNALLRRLVQLMGYDRRFRGLEFELALDPTLPAIRTSAESLQHALLQLLSWAAESTRAEGRISQRIVTTHAPGDAVEVCMLLPARLNLGSPEARRHLLLSEAILEPLGAQLLITPQGGDDIGAMRLALLLPRGEDPAGR